MYNIYLLFSKCKIYLIRKYILNINNVLKINKKTFIFYLSIIFFIIDRHIYISKCIFLKYII